MKIVHIISNLGLGGAETSLFRLVRASTPLNIQHTIIAMKSGGIYANRLRQLGAGVIELNLNPTLAGALRLPGLARALRDLQPDVIQGWMYHGNVAASLGQALVARPAKVCWNVRQTSSRLRDDKLLTQSFILSGVPLSRFCSTIIYNSATAARQHEAYGYARAKRQIIDNGIDCDEFKPNPEGHRRLCALLRLPDSARLIGRVGRKARMKDHRSMLEAFAALARDPACNLVLAGPGMRETDAELAHWARLSGAPERVHFLGSCADIASLMPGFDVNVSSSATSEGFPNVVAEGMACGVPTIATDVGESRAILGDPSRIVQPGDPTALASCISAVLAMPRAQGLAIGQRDRDRTLQRFSIAATVHHYVDTWSADAALA